MKRGLHECSNHALFLTVYGSHAFLTVYCTGPMQAFSKDAVFRQIFSSSYSIFNIVHITVSILVFSCRFLFLDSEFGAIVKDQFGWVNKEETGCMTFIASVSQHSSLRLTFDIFTRVWSARNTRDVCERICFYFE